MQAALPLNKLVPLHSFGLVTLLLAGIVLVPLPEAPSDFPSRPNPSDGEVKGATLPVGAEKQETKIKLPVPKMREELATGSRLATSAPDRAEENVSGVSVSATDPSEQASSAAGMLELTKQSSDQVRAELIQHALSWQGVAYAWGGNSRSGIDCSALVQKVFACVGISLPRTTYGQFRLGVGVAQLRLLPGDLVFFNTSGPGASHVGIYLGGTEFLSATRRQVEIQSLEMLYWKKAYRGSRRIIE